MVDKIEQLKEKVNILSRLKKFDQGESLLMGELDKNPDNSELHGLLGSVYHKQSKFKDALSSFLSALRLDPTNVSAAMDLAITLSDLSRYEEAQSVMAQLNKHLTQSNGKPLFVCNKIAEMHIEVGLAYETAGLFHEAAQEYRKAKSLNSQSSKPSMRLGRLYLQLQDPMKAKLEFEQVLEVSPDDFEVHKWLGIAHFALKELDVSVGHFQKMQEKDGNEIISRSFLQMIHEQTQPGSSVPISSRQ